MTSVVERSPRSAPGGVAPKRTLRVAILALSAKSYGHDAYFRGLIPALAGHGAEGEFTLFCRDGRYAPLCDATPNVRLRVVSWPGLSIGLAALAWEQLVLPWKLRREGFDVVFTAKNVGILLSPIPCVTSVQSLHPLRAAPGDLPFRNTVLRRMTLLSARRAARVVAVSRHVRDTLVSLGIPGGKISTIYNAVDERPVSADAPRPRGRSRAGFVAGAAKFIPYANLELLFKGFSALRRKGYAGELRFAGGSLDASYEKRMRLLIRELAIERHVRFLGYIPRDELRALMRESDAFLFTSTLEACPFTLLEAMREGAAIVSTDCPPMPEFCGDAALYAAPGDVEAFADAAYRIVTDPEVGESLGGKAVRRSESFRWSETARLLMDALESSACACC